MEYRKLGSNPQSPYHLHRPKSRAAICRGLNQEAINALMGGPSDAELMKQSMAAIQSPDLPLDQKLIAFDNLEQLIEIVDNANNMESLGLWTPLVKELSNEVFEMRRMAAWCLGTAVQNNVKSQERVSISSDCCISSADLSLASGCQCNSYISQDGPGGCK